MRKFCSTCGGQLELSKRFCTECGAVNPFFVSAFSLLGDQSGELERLRLEKERIERELQEKEQAHAEFLKQEQLKKQLEELERQKRENAERERIERERIEEELKKEIARVKEESESYKKKTIGLLQEIQVQLQQKIEEEKKTIEEPLPTPPPAASVETTSIQATTPPVVEKREEPEKKQPKRRLMWTVVPVLAVLILAVWAYQHISSDTASKTSETPGTPQLSSAETEPVDSAETTLTSKAAIDSLPRDIVNNSPSTNITTTATPPAPKRTTADAVVRPVPKADFNLTTFRVKADLIGKPLSGCGIVVQKLSEINRIRNLVLVEKMPSGYLKYKFEVRVVQANEIYTATPYIYYTSSGRFLKIDGTNCE